MHVCKAEQLYQIDSVAVSLVASAVTIPVLDPPISEELPTLNKVRKAIPKLKRSKAVSLC